MDESEEPREFVDGRWMTEKEAAQADLPVCTREEFENLQKQVAEIHEFVAGLAGALNSPMVKSILPPNMRGMLGG